MTTTPDTETHLIERIVALAPTLFTLTGEARDIYAGKEPPIGGAVRRRVTTVKRVSGRRQLHSHGQVRELDHQILMRFDDNEEGHSEAETRMRGLYDALHLSGEWTAAGGVLYLDVRALDEPFHLEARYWVWNCTLWVPT